MQIFKQLKKVVIMAGLMAAAGTAPGSSISASDLAVSDLQLFSKPLITGASISADWASMSPGKRLAERLSPKTDVRVIARGGQPGASVLNGVTPAVLKDRSIVIGFDLFFWDSTRASADAGVRALKTLIANAEKAGVPVVIGDIPELIRGHQPARKELNQMIYRACKSAKNCYVIPLDALYQRISKDGFVEIKGKKYSFFDLVPDGLHIGSVAGEFLADLVYETIRPRS